MSETKAPSKTLSLKRPVEAEDARILPTGSTGTIVGVLKDGVAYIVEFTRPFAALVDLAIEDFEVVREERDD